MDSKLRRVRRLEEREFRSVLACMRLLSSMGDVDLGGGAGGGSCGGGGSVPGNRRPSASADASTSETVGTATCETDEFDDNRTDHNFNKAERSKKNDLLQLKANKEEERQKLRLRLIPISPPLSTITRASAASPQSTPPSLLELPKHLVGGSGGASRPPRFPIRDTSRDAGVNRIQNDV